jgi:putative flippase GtrA
MKVVRYFLVGGVAAAVDIAIFFVFAKELGFNYQIVGAVGFVIATLVNYFLSVAHVFQSGVRFGKKQEIFWVYLVSLVGLAFNQFVLYLTIDVAGIEMMLGKITATASVFFWNYYARQHFIFREAN